MAEESKPTEEREEETPAAMDSPAEGEEKVETKGKEVSLRNRQAVWGWVRVGLLVMLLGVTGALVALRWACQPVSLTAAPRLVTIPPGASLSKIAHQLEREGLIRRAWIFIHLAKRQGKAASLQAGQYELSPHLTPQEILDRLTAGEVAVRWITFPEGFTLRQMAERWEQEGFGPAAEYLRWATERASEFGVKGLPVGQTLEGYLFPDTYRLPVGASARDLIALQVKRFEEVYADLVKTAQPRLSRHEIVALASLVEREARTERDRPLIAGVLYNRLERHWRLECDASVLYALGEHKSRVLYRDLRVDSPYNTYRYAGLPPGPIANPGRASLAAALHPAKTEALYYVARPDGSHVFSRTLAEHRRAIAEIRR